MSELEIWTEKYRPKKLNEVIGQKTIVEKLKAFVSKENLPHLLFSGPAGIGKTTSAMALAKELFNDNWKYNLLELNASDERGIDTVRVKVKNFARTKPLPGTPFKIIMLDEADALTKDAQHALRRTMENYTNTCRFVLNVNYASKIILPIQSRCAIFRFKPLEKPDIDEYITRISNTENLTVTDSGRKALIDSSEGDLRKVTNTMQSCASLDKEIDEELVYSVSGIAKPKEIDDVLKAALDGQMKIAKDKMFELMINYGLSGVDAIKLINKHIWEMDIPNKKKMWIIDKIGEYEFRMVEGANEFLQIEALLAQFGISGKD